MTSKDQPRGQCETVGQILRNIPTGRYVPPHSMCGPSLGDVLADPEGHLQMAGVPRRLSRASFDNSPDLSVEMVRRLRAYAARPTGMMLLHGSVGSGKTWSAVSIFRHLVTTELKSGGVQLYDTRFIAERKYKRMLKASFDDGAGSQRDSRDPSRVRFLVFDDLGATRMTDWGTDEVAQLIEDRYDEELPTIVTSNLNPDDIAKFLDPRLVSRLVHDNAVLAFPDRDLRLTGQLRSSAEPVLA